MTRIGRSLEVSKRKPDFTARAKLVSCSVQQSHFRGVVAQKLVKSWDFQILFAVIHALDGTAHSFPH